MKDLHSSFYDEVLDYLDCAQNSFLILNPEGSIIWANNSFYNLYGYSRDEYIESIGKTIFNLSGHKEFLNIIEKIKTEAQSIRVTNICETKHGFKLLIQSNITPYFTNKSNGLDKIIITEIDITSFKEAEEELHQKNEHTLSLMEYLEEANVKLEKQKKEIDEQKTEIEEEQEKSNELLLNMFPETIAHQLKKKGYAKPKLFKQVTVLFTDFKNFTNACESLEPKELVEVLDGYFSAFDNIVSRHFVEKIKTIGDAYFCVGGLPLKNRSHPFNVVMTGIEIQDFMNSLNNKKEQSGEAIWELRCGIHTGEVVAGVVGKRKYVYDIWGDTVNVASRMESSGAVGMVNVSGTTYEIIKDYFDCTYRGKIEVKNKGKIDMYFVNRIRPEYSEDSKGIVPNEEFRKFISSL